jgi:hypothetical protein
MVFHQMANEFDATLLFSVIGSILSWLSLASTTVPSQPRCHLAKCRELANQSSGARNAEQAKHANNPERRRHIRSVGHCKLKQGEQDDRRIKKIHRKRACKVTLQHEQCRVCVSS